MEWLLIAIVVLCVIALIVIAIMRKKAEDEATTPTPKIPEVKKEPESKKTSSPVVKTRFEKKQEPLPEQITIYAYQMKPGVRRCRYCEGENSMSAAACCICGERLY